MKQQPSKKAIGISAALTGLILIGLVGVNLSRQGWSMALANPLKIEQVQAGDLTTDPFDSLDTQAADPTTAPDLALDPALEAALDAALDPDMDPALKESLKSALRSALAPQTISASTGTQPPIVVTVEPVYMPGQQQAASDGQQRIAPASAPIQSAPTTDQVVAAYQAQLEQAYAALQDAYTQIDTLQAAPSVSGNTNISYQGDYDDDHDDDHDDDDDHDGDHDHDEHEREHDDD